MATDTKDVRIPVDEALRATLDEAKSLTGVQTYTDVFRLGLTTLVRKLKAEGRIGA